MGQLKDAFKDQSHKTRAITQADIEKLGGKTIYSDYQVGDVIMAMFVEEYEEEDEEVAYQFLSLVAERELDQLEEEYELIRVKHGVPIIKAKS